MKMKWKLLDDLFCAIEKVGKVPETGTVEMALKATLLAKHTIQFNNFIIIFNTIQHNSTQLYR
jgi:hypothetical protein